VSDLLAGLLSALVATNTPLAVSNLVQQKTGLAIPIANPNDPIEQEYQKLLTADDEAVVDFTRWRTESRSVGSSRDGVEVGLLNNRIRLRAAPIRQGYDEFLQKNPKHTNARVAYAAFLEEIGEEEEAGIQLKKAVELDANSPVAHNNLANHYGHNGGVTNAFPLYERAMQLAPTEPLYCDNLATSVFLFRRDAMAHYGITEPEVFAKALGLYRRGLDLDPTNFDRAVELAKSYYGVRLPPNDDPAARRQAETKLGEEALAAWAQARKIASSDEEREGVLLHFARWQINLARLDEARRNLDAVTNAIFSSGKATLLKKLEGRVPAEPAQP